MQSNLLQKTRRVSIFDKNQDTEQCSVALEVGMLLRMN